MWQDFKDYILSEVDMKNATVAEIAIGKFKDVADTLEKTEKITVIKTDINPDDESIIKDDITNPDLDLYKDVSLIYSIRPPSELQPYIIDLATILNVPLIIKPLFNEDINSKKFKMKLKNYKKASFYILGE